MKIDQRFLEPQQDYSFNHTTGEALVFHTTLGATYKGAEDTLKIRHLSYHFVVDRDGTIYQLIDITRGAWHAGIKSNPTPRAAAFFGTDNPNRRSIGIAFVNKQYATLTPEQRDAGVWLAKEVGRQTGVRYTAANCFAHCELTDYKPAEVVTFKNQVVEGLIGYKDDKDIEQVSKLETIVSLLKMIISLMLEKNAKTKR